MRLAWCGLAVIGALGSVAASPETPPAKFVTPPADPELANLRPVQTPDENDISRTFPDRAQTMGISGSATMNCAIDEQGALADCKVIGEDPPGYGFDQAALIIARRFRWPTVNAAGHSVIGHRETLRIKWRLV